MAKHALLEPSTAIRPNKGGQACRQNAPTVRRNTIASRSLLRRQTLRVCRCELQSAQHSSFERQYIIGHGFPDGV